MHNAKNFGMVIGRLTKDPKVFANSNGSAKVIVNLAVARNYKSEKSSDFIDFTGFVKDANKMGVYDLIRKGDQIAISFSLRENNYSKADGTQVFGCINRIEGIDLLESKAITAARHAEVAETAEVIEDTPFDDAE